MNQAELIKQIAEQTEQKQTVVKDVLDQLTSIIQAETAAGGEVTLQGVAKFNTKHRAAKAGRNPATGEPLQIAAKRVPVVKVLKQLKDAVA